MIYRVARYKVKPENLWEAHEAIKTLVEAVKEKEPGTISCEAFQERHAFQFIHVMTFRDAKAEEQHRESEHVREFVRALYPLCETPPVFNDLKLVASTNRSVRQ
jgi:quinol monooxygenase YgiN